MIFSGHVEYKDKNEKEAKMESFIIGSDNLIEAVENVSRVYSDVNIESLDIEPIAMGMFLRSQKLAADIDELAMDIKRENERHCI